MDEMENLRQLEMEYLAELNKKDLAEMRIEELRDDLKMNVGPEGYIGEFLTMKFVDRKGQTDWKAAVGMMVGGEADAMKDIGEKFRKESTTNFTITSNKKKD